MPAGLLERPDDRSFGDATVDARQFSNLTFFASYARRDQSRTEFVRRVRESRALVLGAGGVGSSIVPELFPSPARDAFPFGDIGLSAVLLVPFTMATMALHECGHWLAARAMGLRARFGVDRRMMLLVFETDLTQVWSVPRARRYGPLLGGMAIDVVLLGVLLTARLLIDDGPLSAVLVNLLRCHNLWRVKSLMLRRAFGRLTAEETDELASASDADRRAGRWFRWLWLAGFAGVLAWFAFFVLPVIVVVLRWAADGMAAGPLAGRFWYCVLCAALLLGPYLLAAGLAAREYVGRLRA